MALSVGFEPVRGYQTTFVFRDEGRFAGMMVIHVDDGTWAGSEEAFLEAQEIRRKIVKIREGEFRTFFPVMQTGNDPKRWSYQGGQRKVCQRVETSPRISSST